MFCVRLSSGEAQKKLWVFAFLCGKKTTLKLRKIRFAYYAGCNTGNTDTSENLGNLITYTTGTLGAKSALGFGAKIGIDSQSVYGAKLFSELKNGKTLLAATAKAAAETLQVRGDYHGHNSHLYSGDGNTKLTPAKFGNQ